MAPDFKAFFSNSVETFKKIYPLNSSDSEISPVYPILCPPYCVKCGYPYPLSVEYCGACEKAKFDKLRSIFTYEKPITDLIVDFKINQKLYARKLIKQLSSNCVEFADLDLSGIDAIIPVPTDHLTYFNRGFNQTSIISEEISRRTNVQILDCLSKRVGFRNQKRLKRDKRIKRSNPFAIKRGHCVSESNLLVVDDVATTLSTLNLIAQTLKQGGAGKVYCLTLARTL